MRRLMLDRSFLPRCLPGARALNPREKEMRDWIGEVRREDVRGTHNTVARIKIDSPIMHEPGGWDLWVYTPTDRVVDAINKAAMDRTIDVIVLELDCPGGTVAGWSDIAEAIDAAKVEKGVVALVHEHAYSLAMRMAVRCEEIVATPTGNVGSIGTLVMMYDDSAMFAEAGVLAKPIGSDGFKAQGYAGVPISEEMMAHIRANVVEPDYAEFVAEVAAGRGMTEEAVRAVGSLSYPAQQALKLGLIDRIETAEAYVAELANGTAQQNNPRPATSDGSGSKGVTMDLAQLREKHPDLVASIAKESAERAAQEIAAANAAAASKPATFDELTAEFAGASEFIVSCMSGKKTLGAARAEWKVKQEGERAKLEDELKKNAERVKQLESLPGAGNSAVPEGGAGKAGGAGGAGGKYADLVKANKAAGMSTADAHADVQKKYPALHAEHCRELAAGCNYK